MRNSEKQNSLKAGGTPSPLTKKSKLLLLVLKENDERVMNILTMKGFGIHLRIFDAFSSSGKGYFHCLVCKMWSKSGK